ncbi:MAG: hypothetical protein AAGA17_00065 [Actinomycetota bacterium]
MEILDVTETVETRERPEPKRRPATPGALWRGLFGNLSPRVALFAAAWVYSSCHLWWILLDLAGEDLQIGNYNLTLAGDNWTHPLRRQPGEVPTVWVIGLISFFAFTLTVTFVSWSRHGRGPARRWFFTGMTLCGFVAWTIYLPDRAFISSSVLVFVVIMWSVLSVGWRLRKQGEKLDFLAQAMAFAVFTQTVYLLLTGFILAYGRGTFLLQLPIAPLWIVGMGGTSMAILVASKAVLIIAAAVLTPWTATKMIKI